MQYGEEVEAVVNHLQGCVSLGGQRFELQIFWGSARPSKRLRFEKKRKFRTPKSNRCM